MKHLILVLTLTFSSLSFSQSISKQVIGTSGKTLTNSNLKLSYTVGKPVVGLMTAGGNQLGNGYYPALDMQTLSIEASIIKQLLETQLEPLSPTKTYCLNSTLC